MKELIKKLINRYWRIIFLIGFKKIDIKSLVSRTIIIQKKDISCFYLSSNPVMFLDVDGVQYTFRECCKHVDFKLYYKKKFDDFCQLAQKGCGYLNFKQQIPIKTKYSEKEISLFKSYMFKCEKKKSFMSEIKDVGYYMKQDGFNHWEGQFCLSDYSLKKLGFLPLPYELVEIFACYLIYIRNAINTYLLHDFLIKNEYETFPASRSMSTFVIAKMFGLETLVPKSEFVQLNVEGELMYGILCDVSPGERAIDSNSPATPSLQKELTNLRLLDAICLQPDHGPNNYNVACKEDSETYISSFDNDCNWTFFPWPRVQFYSAGGCEPILNENGELRIPYMDEYFVNRLQSLNMDDLKRFLLPYLNKIQIYCVMRRIKQLRKALANIEETEWRKRVIRSDGWSEETIKEELCGKYGNTYLVQYINRKVAYGGTTVIEFA